MYTAWHKQRVGPLGGGGGGRGAGVPKHVTLQPIGIWNPAIDFPPHGGGGGLK